MPSPSLLVRSPETGPLVGLVGLSLTFQVASGGQFLTTQSLLSVTALAAAVGLTALGVTLLMIAGEFDLSVSATFSTAPIVMGLLMQDHSWPPLIALATGLCVVVTIGFVNGVITIVTGVQSFIVTLAMLFVVVMAERMLLPSFSVEYLESDRLKTVLGGRLGGTPFTAPFIWLVVIAALLWFVCRNTQFGNWTSASGYRGGDVARAMGVPVGAVKIANFMLCAGLAGLAGCLQFANFGLTSLTSGVEYNLLAIVATVIGGTSLLGARGTVVGTLIGSLMLGTLSVGLILIGTSGDYYVGLTGVLLIVAGIINARLQDAGAVRARVYPRAGKPAGRRP